MDNLTHSLIGLIAGEAVVQHTAAEPDGLSAPVRRKILIAVAVIGSNSPDLDLLFSMRHGGNVGYMLWHRGYTHTVLGCLALSLLLYAAAEIWLRLRHLKASRRDRMLIIATAAFTTALHLAMDFLNSYGVHPFWPADGRWRYGDSVFIVEPLYWAAAAPLFFLVRSRGLRVFLAAAYILVTLLGVALQLISAASCAVLAVSGACLVAMGRSLDGRTAARLSVALALAVTGAFALAGREAALKAEALSRALFAPDRLIDHVLTPMPVNPFCWDLILLQENGDRYIARHAILAIAPQLTAAAACPADPQPTHTAPLTPVAAADSAQLRWLGEFSMARSQLSNYVEESCTAAEFMQFARAPFVLDSGVRALMGDLRFDHGRESGSFEVALSAESKGACESSAPWDPPRADLLLH